MAEDKKDLKNTGQNSKNGAAGKEGEAPVILATGQAKSSLSNPTKLKFSLAILVLMLVLAVAGLVALSGGGGKKQITTLTEDSSGEDRATNNNSAGYLQSPNGNFSSPTTLNLSYALPELMVSKADMAGLNQQVAWQNGFTVMAVSVDRDYRPASEFTYKKIAESGDELVRVNFVVGNATGKTMAIGYNDLALYSLSDDGVKKLPERISEDVYSPKDGQNLGAGQTQNISLHFRIKRGSHFNIVKTQTFEQKKARENKGEEKNPVLSLVIQLP